MSQNQLYGEMDAFSHGATSAANHSDSIDAHRAALGPIVDAIRGGGWEGQSRRAFDTAYDEWEAGIATVVKFLRALGDNTASSIDIYGNADEDANAQISRVQSPGAFNGALSS